MHLHCHLKECVEDFSPVYAFWLFGFERLNGILGGFHTNNHDVTLQLMHRFLASSELGVHNWPSEYKNEFLPVLHKQDSFKGSLTSDTLETALESSYQNLTPSPPIRESALQYFDKESLNSSVLQILGHSNFTTLTLFQKSSALMINGFVIGSKSSRYKTSSQVMVMQSDHSASAQIPKLAVVHYYLKLDVLESKAASDLCKVKQNVCIWFAAVSFYIQHQCRVWFGSPIEVWSSTTASEIAFIPISCIKCRVAYSRRQVDFGKVLGTETVMIRLSIVTV